MFWNSKLKVVPALTCVVTIPEAKITSLADPVFKAQLEGVRVDGARVLQV